MLELDKNASIGATMPTWDAKQYLRFEAERSRPCQDLISRLSLRSPRRIIDLGCGPGNSTALLAERWPTAEITGLDYSPAMIAAASASSLGSKAKWIAGNISEWADGDEPFDLIFSNAAMQWVSDHSRLFPRLLDRVAPSGVLAIQVPNNIDAPAHRLMRELAGEPTWADKFPEAGVREWHVHPLLFYYEALAAKAARIDIWQTEYIHVLPGQEQIVEWYKGTGMRPFLDALSDAADRAAFTIDYLQRIRLAYPACTDGRVLFPFQRLFLIAER